MGRSKAARPAALSDGALTPGYQTRALIRALSILDVFRDDAQVWTLAELHARLGLPKSTILRLGRALESWGYLVMSDGTYAIGPKALELGAVYAGSHAPLEVARPAITAVSRSVLQTCCLAVQSGQSALHAVVVAPPKPVHHVTAVGTRAPMHSSGLGKALLSALPPAELRRFLRSAQPFERFTAKTICDPRALAREIELTRQRGYAIDNEESALGLRCVAVVATLPAIGRAALSVSGPAAEHNSDMVPMFRAALDQAVVRLQSSLTEISSYQERTSHDTESAKRRRASRKRSSPN